MKNKLKEIFCGEVKNKQRTQRRQKDRKKGRYI
jgi:hypothetical protein